MACSCSWSLTTPSVLGTVAICQEVYSTGSIGVRTAALATASQILQSFTEVVQEPEHSDESDEDRDTDEVTERKSPVAGEVDELVPVLKYLCDNLKECSGQHGKQASPLLLQCVLAVLSSLKEDVQKSSLFISFIWQQLCPLLIGLIGSPRTDKNIISSQKGTVSDSKEMGRGSGCLAVAPTCHSAEAKTIYSIAKELVRLAGCVKSLRPVLESLFHRMLLYPPSQHRLEALKAVRELLGNPELLLKFAGPPLYGERKTSHSSDLDLIKIVMDSLEECCHSNDTSVCYASVSCTVALLSSLEHLATGEGISDQYVQHINSLYTNLHDVDYKGAQDKRNKTSIQDKSSSLGKYTQRVEDKVDDTSNIYEENKELNSVEYENETCTTQSDLNYTDSEYQGRTGTDKTEEKLKNRYDVQMSTDSCCSTGCEDIVDIESVLDEKESVEKFDETISSTSLEKQNEQELEADDRNSVSNDENQSIEICKLDTEDSSKERKCASVVDKTDEAFSVIENGADIVEDHSHTSIETDDINETGENKKKADFLLASDTESSGTTEGPEEGFDNEQEEMNHELEEEQRRLAEEERARREKAPRTLLGQEDAGKTERERVEKLCEMRNEFAQQERENAHNFVQSLQNLLPKLLSIRSSIECDQAIQEFASNYCEGIWHSQREEITGHSINKDYDSLSRVTIVNADGIYLATFSALLLNLKLLRNKYYINQEQPIPLTEHGFVEEVHGSGVLVFLSATWLAEVYQQVLKVNLLEVASYNPMSPENSALINLLTDVDGLGNTQQGSQQLSDYVRLERAVTNIHITPNMEAGMKIARRVLTACWNTGLEVLSVLLDGTNSCGITSTIGLLLATEASKEELRRASDAIAESLDGLQRSAKLCNALGLQSHCSAIFAQLAIASCPMLQEDQENITTHSQKKYNKVKKSVLPGKKSQLKLHTSHIMSMDVILSRGLELGSHSPDCWKHVFRCCSYVLEVEHTYFSGWNQTAISMTRQLNSSSRLDRWNQPTQQDSGLFLPPITGEFGDDQGIDPVSMPGTVGPPEVNILQLLQKGNTVEAPGYIVKDQKLQEIIEGLSQLVDRLFEDAANKLNLAALIGFLTELSAASQTQLFSETGRKSSSGHNQSSRSHNGNTLLLFRLSDVMLRCVRGGRPLIHVMKAWSVAAPHFVEAACHKDQEISKKAVTSIHDIVSALLSSNTELPHFHFNEALFKPFENLLCLELCDTDIQELIISLICEFVEGSTTDIRSGWRPLFGALRAIRLPGTPPPVVSSIENDEEIIRHLRVVLDVFNAFLGTDNVLVFANAAVDCLLCLLKHVRGPAELQDNIKEDSTKCLEEEQTVMAIPLNLCLAALKYLERCAEILAFMYQMPACPIFSSAHRIKFNTEPTFVDPVIPNMKVIHFESKNETDTDVKKTYAVEEEVELIKPEESVSLKKLDQATGILHVWFLLLEGLAGAVATCPRRYQPHTMETLFTMLQNLHKVPGPEFGIYCVNHLLLPMLQGWLRRTSRIYRGWDNFASNFKQCCGLATDLIVDYLKILSEQDRLSEVPGVSLMLQQLLLVLTECIAQSKETISRLGCACIRHVITSAAPVFTPDLWTIVCVHLQRAFRVTLQSVRQLMVCFHTDSENFYGDIGQVKVAARRDCTVAESERLRQLAHQVFFLDCQRVNPMTGAHESTIDDERSYIFLLHPPDVESTLNPEMFIIRVPFRSLVVGLLSHQILLQTMATVLLQGTPHLLPSVATLLPSSVANSNASYMNNSSSSTSLPGFLSCISYKHLEMLLSCLQESYTTACEFDLRPGLKFLIQKVIRADVAANLYKQAGISWTIQALVLFELCFHHQNLTLEHVNEWLHMHDQDEGVNTNRDATANCSNKGTIHQQKENAALEAVGTGDLHASTETYQFTNNHNSDSRKLQSILERPPTISMIFDAKDQKLLFNAFWRLQNFFFSLCDSYADMCLDKDGNLAVVDRIVDQPIFFLVAPQEDVLDGTLIQKPNTESSSVTEEKDGTESKSPKLVKQTSTESTDSETGIALGFDDKEDKVYSVATEKTIQSMLNEYKRKKIKHSMPSSLRDKPKTKWKPNSVDPKQREDTDIPEEINRQRRSSIMKDGEAHLQVWTQLIQSLLELHLSLSESQFSALLPVVFPGVRTLVAYASSSELRLSVAEWLLRVATVRGFSGQPFPLTPEA
ncbi:brefeldin A-inhibited guanine nucleotide-exchange protein 3-like isoform X2 [Limulus polyphemus]|uniref:Brefeldin A-inhibited guanine nucleotide-exchange protein 3-like isoform X2 n=1 Tax=Limulus polyphemus TaxID=6850 RepID=A0ABM1S0M0_LIMPO|nr:brefeldin A-inhibited guanine nucleotide-exchange protein 3-like isoform X2 [Limulus polyphemus]